MLNHIFIIDIIIKTVAVVIIKMPIIFLSLNSTFIEKAKARGFEAHVMDIVEYVPTPHRKTYYVSPANSLCFMDGGIDLALSRIIFPGVENKVQSVVKLLGITNLVGKSYLPIGSSIIMDEENVYKSLIVSPTMLMPQNVAGTKNAYYATMAVLYNILINKGENLHGVDILFPSLCCGYGKMDEETAIQQIVDGIRDFKHYASTVVNENIIIHEPNLLEQPKYYMNTVFFEIDSKEIVHCDQM